MNLRIRPAEKSDAERLAEIYAPYVEETAVTFETTAPDKAEFARRIVKTLYNYPYFVCEDESGIVGYAYAGTYRSRSAYRWDVELSVYVDMTKKGIGIGRALYTKLLEELTRQGFVNAYACISLTNTESVAFHEKFGFRKIGLFERTGYKNGKWYDCIWMELKLSDAEHPGSIRPFLRI